MKRTLPNSQKNFQEWGKKDECWEIIKELSITLNEELVKNILIKTDDFKKSKKEAIKEQKKYNEELDYMKINMIEAQLWKKIHDFILKNKLNITPKENEILSKKING